MSNARAIPTPFKHKQRMKYKVTTALASLVIFFVVLYLPPDIMTHFVGAIETAYSRWIQLGGSIPLILIAQWLIFAQDQLANGNSTASRFFRGCYPSTYAIEVFGVAPARARTLWFDYFNSWGHPDHPDYTYYRINFERSYSLRLIFYLKRLLCAFFCAREPSHCGLGVE